MNGPTGSLDNVANLVAQDSVGEQDLRKLNLKTEGKTVMVDQRFLKIVIYPSVQVM